MSGGHSDNGGRSIERSTELLDAARELIPGGSQTNNKSPAQFVTGVSPTHIERGEGCRVWDVDGNEYVDIAMGLGPGILGHNYPAVTEAVEEQLQNGTAFSMPHPLQVDVARAVRDVVPCAEMVKFAKNGNDVTTAAAKLARAHTGRDVIVTQGYHGWPDVWSCAVEPALGIPDAVGEYTATFEYNDVESLERAMTEHSGDVAAIVTTPVNDHPPEDGFLEEVREIADREDALLVFDEILTGFRFSMGGGQEYFDVTPDLAGFAKGISNGFPLSALAGREDVMRTMDDERFIFSQTYSGEAASLAAAKACIEEMRQQGDVQEHIIAQTTRVRNEYDEFAADHGLGDYTECVGLGPMASIEFHDEAGLEANLLESVFVQETHRRGVLSSGGRHLLSYSHTDEAVDEILSVYDEVLGTMAEWIEGGDLERHLEGERVGTMLNAQTD
jgi:glutamate-1-semialdehyde aminotransferase